jgi:hypothetical protein
MLWGRPQVRRAWPVWVRQTQALSEERHESDTGTDPSTGTETRTIQGT